LCDECSKELLTDSEMAIECNEEWYEVIFIINYKYLFLLHLPTNNRVISFVSYTFVKKPLN
jgi:hypothetical protein